MQVKSGEIAIQDPHEKSRQEAQEFRLREKLVPNKYRKLYKSMKEGQKARKKEVWLKWKKRRTHEESEAAKRKEARKAQKKAAANA